MNLCGAFQHTLLSSSCWMSLSVSWLTLQMSTSRLTLPVSDSAKEEYCFGAFWYIVMTYDFIFPGLLGTVSVACNFRFWRFRASALIEEVFAARTGSRPIAGCRSLADSYFLGSSFGLHIIHFVISRMAFHWMSLLSFVFQKLRALFDACDQDGKLVNGLLPF